jgi:hypothetical protein
MEMESLDVSGENIGFCKRIQTIYGEFNHFLQNQGIHF